MVKLPAGIDAKQAIPVNLRGEPEGKPVKIKNGSFKIQLGAFAPASFLFDTQRGNEIRKRLWTPELPSPSDSSFMSS